jgi:cellulose biosynthesis protein BcsQ
MRSIAIYSLKGGVGKTTLTVSLAWASAMQSSRRTLLWDLDPQAAASFMLGATTAGKQAQAVFARDVDPAKLIRRTAIDRLDLLPADASLRGLDRLLFGLAKKKRLLKLIEDVGRDYDRVLLDSPPGLTETSEQVLRAADLVLVPLIPDGERL